jgi:general secretion pathway protein G
MKRIPGKKKGFSLIELMVVIAIMAMLAGGVSIFLFGAKGDAEKARVRSDFAQLDSAINLYRLKMSKYPESLEELTKPLPGHDEALLQKVPKDPWGEPYQYRKAQGRYEIFTLGADKTEGGEGSDGDLSSLDEDEDEEQQ